MNNNDGAPGGNSGSEFKPQENITPTPQTTEGLPELPEEFRATPWGYQASPESFQAASEESGILLKEPGKRHILTLKDGMKTVGRDPFVIGFFILWILLLAMRFYVQTAMRQEKPSEPPPEAETRIISYIEKIMYLDFLQEGTDTKNTAVSRLLVSQLSEEYRTALEKHPDNENLLYRYVIFQASADKREDARKYYQEHKKNITDPNIREIMEKVWLQPESISPADSQRLEAIIKSKFNGWYQERTLLELYTITKQEQKHRELLEATRQKALPMIAQLVAVGCTVIGIFVLGLLLIGFVIYYLAVRYKRDSMEVRDIRVYENREFFGYTLRNGLLIFFVWELAREAVSLAQGIVMLFLGKNSEAFILKNIGIMLVISYAILYSIVLFFAVTIIRRTAGRIDLKALGLSFESAKQVMKEFVLGVCSYISAVPVMFAVALLYSLITQHTPQSSNPAFNLIKNAGSPLNLILLFFVIGILAPIFEEILFRGFLYNAARRYMRAYAAILVVGIVFAAIHFDPGAMVPLFVLGVILSVLREATGSLIPGIVVHSIWNSMTFIMFITLFG